MATLYDAKTGQPVDLPEDQVQAALQSGQYGAPAGTSLTLLGPDGKPAVVPIEQAKEHFGKGFIYLGDEGAKNLEAEEKYGDRPVAAAGLGALDTLSFGTAPEALISSGVIPRETYKGIEEHNVAPATGGKILGAVLPSVFTGGAAAPEEAAAVGAGEAASAAKAAGGVADLLPGAAVSRVGGAAEKAVTGALGEGAGAKVVASAVRGAVEAPAYAAGDVLTENAIDNKPLTAEALLAEGTSAALFGAGAGGAFEGALGLARKAAPAALERVSGALEKLSGKLEEASNTGKLGRVANALDSASGGIDQGVKEAMQVRQDLVDMHLAGREAVPELEARVGQLAEAPGAPKALRALQDDLGQAKDAAEQFSMLEKASKELPDTYGQAAKSLLEDTGVFGKAAEVQKEFGAKLGEFKQAEEALSQRFMRPKLGPDEVGNAAGQVPDLRKLGSVLKGLAGKDEVAAESSGMLKGYLDRAKGLVDFAKEASADLPSGRRNLHQVGSLVDKLNDARDAAVKGLTPSPLEHLEHFLPHMVRGPIAAVGAVSRNAEVIAHVLGKTAKYTEAISSGVKSVLTGASGGKLAGPTGALLTHHFGTEPARGEDRHDSLERHREDLARLASNPQATADRLSQATPELGRHAPQLAAVVQTKAVQAAAYLRSQLPSTGTPNPFPGMPKPKASDAALAAYERKARAVQNPLTVLHDASRGRLTRDAVLAVQQVHPETYQAMVTELQQQLASSKSRVAYSARLQISVLLGKPLDPTLKMLGRLQSNVAPAPTPSPDGPPQPGSSGDSTGPVRQPSRALGFANRAGTRLSSLQGGTTP